jgi:hypothetical protein
VTGSVCALLDDLAPALAIGALDPEEARAALTHVRSCARPHPSLRDALTVASAIGISLPDEHRPSPALRARLLRAAREESITARR